MYSITSEKIFDISEQMEQSEYQNESEEQQMMDEEELCDEEEPQSALQTSERLDGSLGDDFASQLE